MKNLTKIFMAVAVAMFAFSCVNDATEDIAVKVGGKTTLAISLENTRTQLGEAENGVYPITWAEGDQITVNGETSEPLAAADADTANAVFTFNAELAAPYCVAYPAAEANQVVFAAEQEYVDGTFANGAATMYGYARNGNITLNHLTGVLKIGVVCGEDVDFFDAPIIQSVKISTIDRAPIAGAFNIDFTTGAVTATDDAVSVITYNVNMKLSTDPTYLHVAVPAGVYNELYVTLEDSEGGVMYKTVKAIDEKPLAAGKVREFSSDIVYVATDEVENLVVRDYASLLTVKEVIETAEAANDAATLAKDITFVADVDINPAFEAAFGAWSSINAPNYKGTVKGNGYAISGLTQPLFDVTAASFKGLHLNVEIEETENPNFGVFARQIVAVSSTPVVVENCSINGTITINTAITATAETVTQAAAGAFTGIAAGVNFNNCTNNAAITVNSIVSSENTQETWGVNGGIAGVANASNGLFVSFTNCHNKGAITYSESFNQPNIKLQLGGILGNYNADSAVATFDNCSNSGDITMNGTIKSLNIAGIIGYMEATSDTKKEITFNNTISNSGKLTKAGTQSHVTRIGGILGYLKGYITATFTGSVINDGDLIFNGAQTSESINLGGIVCQTDVNACRVDFNNPEATTINNGDIKVLQPAPADCNCAGIIARAKRDNVTSPTYFRNKTTVNNGEIYISTTISGASYIGGIAGNSSMAVFYYGNNCKVVNNANITLDNAIVNSIYLSGYQAYVNGGGSANVSSSSVGQRVNKGNITVTGEVKGNCYIGGLGGYHNLGVTINSINTGNITLTAKFNTSKSIRVAGAYANHRTGTTESKITMSNFQVYCDVFACSVVKDGDEYKFTSCPQTGIFTAQKSISTVKDCKVGGRIATTATVENGVVKPTWVTVTTDNYAEYMFGVRSDYVYNTMSGVTVMSSVADIAWGNFGE